jgi:histidine triad (HIT) family protein
MLVMPPVAAALAVELAQRFAVPNERKRLRYAIQALLAQVPQERVHCPGLWARSACNRLGRHFHGAKLLVHVFGACPELVVRHDRTVARSTSLVARLSAARLTQRPQFGTSLSAAHGYVPVRDCAHNGQVTAHQCIFCDIANGRSPARFVYQDEQACAFLDIEPVRPGHSLVVPRAHVTDLTSELAAEGIAGMSHALHKTASLLRNRLPADGVSVFQSNGVAAGQTVDHLHFHLVPRLLGDVRLTTNWMPARDAIEALDSTHAMLI